MRCQRVSPRGVGWTRSRHDAWRRLLTSPTVASRTSNPLASPNHSRNAPTICEAPRNSAGPRGSNARITAAGSKQSVILLKSRAAIASTRSPATDQRVRGAGDGRGTWQVFVITRFVDPSRAARIGSLPYFWSSVAGVRRPDEPMPHGEQRCRAARAHAEFGVDVLHVRADSLGRKGQFPRDALLGQAS